MALFPLFSGRSSVLLPAALGVPLLALAPGGSALQARQGDPEIRVLLAKGELLALRTLDRPLRLRSGGGSTDVLVELPAASPLELSLAAGRVTLKAAGGHRVLPAAPSYWLEAGSADPQPSPAGVFQLQQRRFRGRLQVRVDGASLQAINHVALETYLPSVVGSEMPARWPQAALRAQAVAARTYALRQRKPSAAFDVTATVSSQVYKGVESETDTTREAVTSTRGQVLMYGSGLANTVFHSSSGGRTENSGDIWSQQLPYLVSVPDFDDKSPVHQWEKPLPPDVLRKAFGEIGGVQRIEVVATTATGRVRQARVVGPAGVLVVTGPELRSRLGLRSTQVRFEVLEPRPLRPAAPAPAPSGWPTPPPPVTAVIDSATGFGATSVAVQPAAGSPAASTARPPGRARGSAAPSLLAIGRGYGHGVGMSQWGALAMAEQGQGHERILSHYFRGTELRRFTSP